MKKNSKPVVMVSILLLLLVTLILLTVQGFRFKCEELIRQRTALEEEIRSEKFRGINLIASYQTLTSEDRIEEYAVKVLGLFRANSESTEKIILNKNQINEVTDILKDSYE